MAMASIKAYKKIQKCKTQRKHENRKTKETRDTSPYTVATFYMHEDRGNTQYRGTMNTEETQKQQNSPTTKSELKEEPRRHEAYLNTNSDNGSETGSKNKESQKEHVRRGTTLKVAMKTMTWTTPMLQQRRE